jgi:hypothetical protein
MGAGAKTAHTSAIQGHIPAVRTEPNSRATKQPPAKRRTSRSQPAGQKDAEARAQKPSPASRKQQSNEAQTNPAKPPKRDAHAILAPTLSSPLLHPGAASIGPTVASGASALSSELAQEASSIASSVKDFFSLPAPNKVPSASIPPAAAPSTSGVPGTLRTSRKDDGAPHPFSSGADAPSGHTQLAVLESNWPDEALSQANRKKRKWLLSLAQTGQVVPFDRVLKTELVGRQLEGFQLSKWWTSDHLGQRLGLTADEVEALKKDLDGKLPLDVTEALYDIRSVDAPIVPQRLSGKDVYNWRKERDLNIVQAALGLGTATEVLEEAEKLWAKDLPDSLVEQIPFLNRIIKERAPKNVPPSHSMTGKQFEEWLRIRGVTPSYVRTRVESFPEVLNPRLYHDSQLSERAAKAIRRVLLDPQVKVTGKMPLTGPDIRAWLSARGLSVKQGEALLNKDRGYFNSLGRSTSRFDKASDLLLHSPQVLDARLTGDQFLALRLARGWATQAQAAAKYGTSEEMVSFGEALGPGEIFPELAIKALSHPAPALFTEKNISGEEVANVHPAAKKITGNQLWAWQLFTAVSPEEYARGLGIDTEELSRLKQLKDEAIPFKVEREARRLGIDPSVAKRMRVAVDELKRLKPDATLSRLSKELGLEDYALGFAYTARPVFPLYISLKLREMYPDLPPWTPPPFSGSQLLLWQAANGLTSDFTAGVLDMKPSEMSSLTSHPSKQLPENARERLLNRRVTTPAVIGQPMSAEKIQEWVQAQSWDDALVNSLFGRVAWPTSGDPTKASDRALSRAAKKIHLLKHKVSRAENIGLLPSSVMTGERFARWSAIRRLQPAQLGEQLGVPEEAVIRAMGDSAGAIPWKEAVDNLSAKLPAKVPPPLTWGDVGYWLEARGMLPRELAGKVGLGVEDIKKGLQLRSLRADAEIAQYIASMPLATNAHVTGDEMVSWRLGLGLNPQQAAYELDTSKEMILFSEGLGNAEIFPELALRLLTHPKKT